MATENPKHDDHSDHSGHNHANVDLHASVPTPPNVGPTGTTRVVYRIENMDCATEEGVLRNALAGLPEVKQLGFDLMRRELTVDHVFADAASLVKRIEGVGMQPVLMDAAAQQKNSMGADLPGISGAQKLAMVFAGAAAVGATAGAATTAGAAVSAGAVATGATAGWS